MKNKDMILTVENDTLLLEYLLLKLKDKSKNNIKSILARGSIFIGGKSITKYDYKLHKGDEIIIKSLITNNAKYDKQPLMIVYEDDDLIVIDKPAGLLSIATDKETTHTAYHLVRNHIRRKNPKGHIFIVHRLDRETSGLLLFAKNESIKFLLQDKWNDIAITRGYIGIIEGQLDHQKGTIKSWLKESKTQMVYSSHKQGDGDKAITHYQVLKANNEYSLVDIRIDTGRKNQIRVHMKDLGHHIIGDKKYGALSNPLKRLGLHAYILEIIHPMTKKVMHFEIDIPNEFMKAFN